ncbi:acyl-CoA dehydrogenase family protein [Streptomyces sp. CA-251247]|uniref:acyl-CoA dehydrogenase family protein n=1 Tax=Streptomyces sp. CA-251247 TaxID=3240062 RepID=UPI003D94DC64
MTVLTFHKEKPTTDQDAKTATTASSTAVAATAQPAPVKPATTPTRPAVQERGERAVPELTFTVQDRAVHDRAIQEPTRKVQQRARASQEPASVQQPTAVGKNPTAQNRTQEPCRAKELIRAAKRATAQEPGLVQESPRTAQSRTAQSSTQTGTAQDRGVHEPSVQEAARAAVPTGVRERGSESGEDPAGSVAAALAAGELAHLLFDEKDGDTVHEPWRALVDSEAFAYRTGLTPQERTELSYQRLRLVNEVAGDPEALAHDPRRLAALHEWTGFTDSGLCTISGIHYNLFLGSILDHDGHTRDLTPYTSLQHTGTFLCTELDHGNDVTALETTATLDAATGGFDLHTPTPGARKFMPNTSTTGGPKTALVAARLITGETDHGVYLFLVPLSDAAGHLPGITVALLPERLGSPVDHCITSFDHVPLPRTALLQAPHGHLTPDNTLSSNVTSRRKRLLHSIARVTTGKLCMSAAAIGAARTALDIAVRHAHTRHISGPKAGERVPLAAHRTHSGRLTDALATTYAMTFLHRESLTAHTRTPDDPDTERLVALTKAWATWQARDIITEARERCGAQGLFAHNRLADLHTNIEGTITAEGDNLVIWTKAAAETLFHPTPQPTAVTPAIDPTQATDPTVAHQQLTDPTFLHNLLAHAQILWTQRARTAARTSPRGNPLARWNTTSTPALTMIETHTQRHAGEALHAAATRTTHPTTHHLLTTLHQLFILNQLRPHTGDLLAHNHLTPEHLDQLPHTLNALHTALVPHLPTLTQAFNTPQHTQPATPLTHPAG